MTKYIRYMPDGVVAIIASFYYSPQPAQLMEDVRNYHYTLDIILKKYKECYGLSGPEAVDWCINDIWGWANNHKATIHGHEDEFYHIWERMEPWWPELMKPAYTWPAIKKKRRKVIWYRIDSYITRYLEKKPSGIQIRLFWGVLTKKERENFMKSRFSPLYTEMYYGV